ncbi:MAG: hypothetical protein ACREP8_05325 [Candidatus Binatia bacterium]
MTEIIDDFDEEVGNYESQIQPGWGPHVFLKAAQFENPGNPSQKQGHYEGDENQDGQTIPMHPEEIDELTHCAGRDYQGAFGTESREARVAT